MKKYENEEQIKNDIFDIFSKCQNETSSDRRQTYFGQLCEIIFKWCKDYLSFNVSNMGLEITKMTMRMIKDNIIQKIPNNKDDFFKYLLTSLKNAKNEYYRRNNSDNSSEIFDNDAKTDNTPLDDIISSENINFIKKAILSVLDKKQDRSRDCCRSLITLECKNFEILYPILDNEITTAFQEGSKCPKQYEVYLKYHPATQKNAAEAMASKILKDFKRDLKAYLKEKHPEIFI